MRASMVAGLRVRRAGQVDAGMRGATRGGPGALRARPRCPSGMGMRPGSLLVSALTTVSQRLTVEPIPASAPEARGASRVGTPGLVPSISFPVKTTTSIRASWGTPSDGGRALTGFGLLRWTGDTQPAYSSALVKGAGDRGHTYTGLQADTLYKFRIHACNGADSCGWWTEPPKEVRTLTPPPEPTPTPTPTAATTVGRPGPAAFDHVSR